ncbi:hypothetical protein NP233_g2569 [Leucocoprinus birnbaumii]|uniref:GH18 domain-containing protein n=1 Tax=Leucocoprinus birnbaumii TaxID=56174 RepID=A0AAD5W0H7_9AGAR|nr:hypothetical protein NP233_g2569 [Leucocoprinus birnbaumii]
MAVDLSDEVSKTLGAAFFTFVGGSVLYGITLSQVNQYYKIYPEDSRILKATVAFVCLEDTLHSAFSIHLMWSWLVKGFGNDISQAPVIWSIKVCAVGYLHVFIMLFVQGVYLSRIYLFTRKSIDFGPIARAITQVVGGFLALAAVIVFLFELQQAKLLLDFASGAQWVLYFAFGVTCVVDIGITVGMCFVLHKSKIKIKGVRAASNIVLSKIIIFFISSGLLTTIIAVVYMILYSALPDVLLFIGATFSTSKLYANSVLAMLNGRRHLRYELSKPHDIELLSAMQFQSQSSQGTSTMSTSLSPVEEKGVNARARSLSDAHRAPCPVVRMESRALASVAVNPESRVAAIKSEPDQDGIEITESAAPIAGAYYPSWAAGTLEPEKVAFSKYDIIWFCFVTPNGVAGIDWEDGSKEVLRRLVAAARSGTNTTRIVISMGGWSGCHWMSQAVSTSSNRAKLCDGIVKIINDFGLDGIDIDWEYPNDSGSGNPHSPSDSANLLSLIKLLRGALGSTRIISAAVTHMPWKGNDGKPLRNVAEFAKYMNFVNIMNYDVFGASDPPGPNAPLENRCGTSKQPEANARAAYAQWTKAGMPASRLLLGLPLYGYVSRSNAKKLSGSFGPVQETGLFPIAHPRGPPSFIPGTGTMPAGDLSHLWGQQISFNQLLLTGVLHKKSDGTYDGANGYTMGWDDCSNTPFVFNQARTTVVTYDDTWSLFDKAKFAKESGMGGCFTWSLDQDDGVALQNMILAGLGKQQDRHRQQLG